MIGSVRDLHLMLPLALRLGAPPDLTVEFVIDTGFTGVLTLPAEMIARLGLPFLNVIEIELADGSVVEVPVHTASIIWHGVQVEVPVISTGERPLVGTALLDGSELVAQFRDDGVLSVDEL